jgi:hypothetical protein
MTLIHPSLISIVAPMIFQISTFVMVASSSQKVPSTLVLLLRPWPFVLQIEFLEADQEGTGGSYCVPEFRNLSSKAGVSKRFLFEAYSLGRRDLARGSAGA